MLKFKLLLPDSTLFDGPVHSVTARGDLGQFEILKNHAPFMTSIHSGEVIVKKEGGEKLTFKVNGGVFLIEDNEAVLLGSL